MMDQVSTMTPQDKLVAAMSIIQHNILAEDSACIPDKMFPRRYFQTSGLELAEKLLADVLPLMDELEKPTTRGAA